MRAGDANLPFILEGLVAEVLELGLGGDGSVDLLLLCNAHLPPSACSCLVGSGHELSASRGISHSCHCFLSAAFSFSRNPSCFACHFSQMMSISALVAMELNMMCGTALRDEPVTNVSMHGPVLVGCA